MFLKYLLINVYVIVFRRRCDKFEKVILMRYMYIKWWIIIKYFWKKEEKLVLYEWYC